MELQEIEYIKKFKGWFSRNWEFAGIMILFSLYMFLANYFMWGQTFLDGAANFSGGSDPYFNYYIIIHILTTHHSLLHTSGLNYPIGSGDPRPLFFHWMIAFVATITAPLFGGALHAAYYVFQEFDAVFGALLIIPVYLLGKSILGRKAGMIGAVLYTLMPSNLTSGILSDGRMHTPELIFAFFAIYFFERAVQYATKERVIQGSLLKVDNYFSSIKQYIVSNKKTTFYALFAGASYGALMLSWQGHAYILAIITIYVIAQLLLNLFLSRNTGYLLYISIIFVFLSFAMGGYYYYTAPNAPAIWYVPPLLIGVGMIFIAALISIVGRKPWIIAVPVLVLTVAAFVGGLAFVSPHIYSQIVSGEGYFIKTKLYSTIAEAQAPALGQYIGGFGVAQFVVGIGGFMFVIYKYIKEKTDSLAFLIVFSAVSIYMSFTAARFNITASPAYAIMGGALLYYFADLLKIANVRDDTRTKRAFRKRAGIKGNLNWLQAIFVLIIVFGILIPSGLGVMSAAVPVNSAPNVNHQVYNALPAFARPPSYLANESTYFGTTGSQITNNSSPLSASMQWFATQQANLSLANKPAYVNWWDYGFQELYQGKHPTVADDFQQAYQVAGQILLSTNESQIIGLFSARLMQAQLASNSGKFSPAMQSVFSQYFSNSEIKLLENIYKNPEQYVSWISANSTIYGKFNMSSLTSINAYFALEKGQLASKLSVNNLVNLYQEIQHATGWSIQYIQADHTLLPLSATNTGTFYAPAYLTDTPSYSTSSGAIVPYEYYQIYAVTPNGTYPLNATPANVVPTSFELGYTPAFYNTTIYRALIGLPPSAVGQTNGIPGLSYGSTRYTMEPAFNMSNFEICYEGVPYNPYTNYSSHPNAFTIKSLQQAYSLEHSGKGIAFIFPQLATIIQSSDPILRYFPGAMIEGQIKTSSGAPIPGIRVTIYDQYNVPHSTVVTNKNGFYNITGLPGNDSLIFSYGTLNKQFLEGNSFLHGEKVFVSKSMAERRVYGINKTSGLPNYYIVRNYVSENTSLSGSVVSQGAGNSGKSNGLIHSGTISISNSTSDQKFSAVIANGNYSFANIPFGTYNVSVTTNGKTFNDITTVNIGNASNAKKNISINEDKLVITTTSGKKTLTGVSIYIGKRTLASNSTGSATVVLNTGTYSVFARLGNLVSKVYSVSFNQLNETKTLTMSLISGNNLSISLNGPLLSGNLTLYENGNTQTFVNLTNQGNNLFMGMVPSGFFTIYKTVNNEVVFRSFNINTSSTLNYNFHNAVKTGIIINNLNLSKYSGTIGVINGKNVLQNEYTTVENTTMLLSPNQKYTFYATITKAGKDYFGTVQNKIYQVSNVYLKLNNATETGIEVYNPSVSLGFNAKSAVSSGIAIANISGNSFEATNINSGYAYLFFPTSNLNGVSLLAFGDGYSAHSQHISPTSPMALKVPSHNVTLRFVSRVNASKINGKLNIYGTITQTGIISNGMVNLSLPSGSYIFTIIGGNMIASNYTNSFYVGTMSGKINITFTPEVSLSVTNAETSIIYNMQGNQINNPLELLPGNYTVYSLSRNNLAAIQEVHLTQNMTLTPAYSASSSLSILNKVPGNLTLTLKTNGLLIKLSTLKNILPNGNYIVNLTSSVSTNKGEFILTGSSNVYLDTNAQLSLKIKNETFTTAVKGTLSNKEGFISGYFVNLYHNGILIDQLVSDGTGHFQINLPNGTYTYYAYSSQYMMASTGTLGIGHFQKQMNMSVYTSNAHNVYIYTYVSGSQKILPVNITLRNQLFSVTSSGVPLLLPSHNYTFSSHISKKVTINNFNTAFEFSTSQTVYTYKTTTLNLILTKVLIGNVTLTQNKVKTTNEFKSVSYNLTIVNHLNSVENLTLASGMNSWNMKFNRSTLRNVPINGTINVTLTLNNTAMVPSGLNKVPVLIKYAGGSENAFVRVNLTTYRNFSIKEVQAAPSYNNGTSILSYKLSNTGNSKELIKLNSSSLKLYHWNLSFESNGKIVNNVTLNFSQSKVINIVFSPSVNATSSFTVTINANLTKTNITKSFPISYTPPVTPGLKTYSKGPGIISNYTGNPFATVEYGLIIILIAVVGGIAGIAVRGRKRK
ncbi:MAG: carboxypeptidase regulatory-like domain-containing protein [Cuniculiplasma sp.]